MLSSLTRTALRRTASKIGSRSLATAGFPPPRLFDYDTVTKNLTVNDAISSVEEAFAALAKGNVEVPMPMHIGIHESSVAGPGDCHIKGGYVDSTPTFTVKLACVSFYKNSEKGLPPGSGIFIVVNAATGAPLGVFQENRFMTDLRTGAAGAVAMKHCSTPEQDTVGFIGTGAIARNMARAAAAVRPFKGVAYALDHAMAEDFAKEMGEELGMPFEVASSAEKLCNISDVIFTQTPGSSTVLEKEWLKDTGVTIIASGSDQPTKQEIPNDVLVASKYISDLTKQTSKVGELRGALQAGVMSESDVYAELGQVVNGDVPGREGNEIIVVDLTGTGKFTLLCQFLTVSIKTHFSFCIFEGAQDAAIGQVAWDKLSQL